MILVAGEALVDLVIAVDGSVRATLGGAPFNTARACGRLGSDVAFAGALSRDRFGTLLADQLERDGVDITQAPRVDEPTTLAAAELDERGAATYHFYVERTSAPQLSEPVQSGSAAAVFTGGLALVLEPMAATVETMFVDREPGCLGMVDVNCRPQVIGDRDGYLERLRRVVSSADVVKASDEDLAHLVPDASTDRAAAELLADGASLVLVTFGGDRVEIHTATGRHDVPVAPVEVVDTIGAGDAFDAGLLAWWAGSGSATADLGSPEQVAVGVRKANAVAAATCTRRGADPPWLADLPSDWSA